MARQTFAALRRVPRSRRARFHLERVAGRSRRSWTEVVDWALDLRADLIAFDVYETLLIRQLADPAQRLSVLADSLSRSGAWNGTPADYLKARALASTAVPGSNLCDWYEHPALADRADGPRCVEQECDFEASLTRPVPGAGEALDRLRRAGRRIGFASDMYLPGTVIARLLACHDLRLPDEPLVVSGDVGAWKSTGGLYRRLFDLDGTDPSRAAFIGNDLYVDVAVPSSLGASSLRRANAELNRYETAVAGVDVAGAAIAGAATEARLELDPAGADVAVEVGTGVVGQTLSAFLLAIRQRCHRGDIRQVVFVARDGELPLRMADVMPKGYWSGIELRYVHGNRLAWTLAGAAALGIERWAEIGLADGYGFLMLNRERATPAKLLRRLDLTLDDLPPTTQLRRLPRDQPLGDNDAPWLDLVTDLTDSTTPVAALVSERAQARFERVAGYIAGLGLRREPTLIVDVGWRGQTAAVVSGIFAEALGADPINYHFGGYGVKEHVDAACVIERYAFDDSREPAPFHGIEQCVEMFTSAGRPRAIDYVERNGETVPVFDHGVTALEDPARDRIWDAALRTAELLPPSDRLDRWTTAPPDPRGVLEALRRFWRTPTRAEGMLGTELHLEIDEDGATVMPMACRYRPWEPLAPGRRRWRQGSLAASSTALQAAGRLAIASGLVAPR